MTVTKQIKLLTILTLAAISVISLHAQVQTNTPPAALPPAPPKVPWKGSAAVGVTLTRGNSDTLLATASAVAGKKWAHDELSFGADGTYGETKDQTTGENTVNANSIHGFAQYNRLFTERFFGYARTEALHDEVADVRYRVSLSPGAGYYFIKETNIDLCAEVGPGYVWERLGTNDSSFATLRLGEKFHYTLNDHVRLWQTAECSPQVDKFENYVINAEIGIEADLTKKKDLTLRAFLQDAYSSEPAAGRKKNDAKLVTAIAYKF
jgi:putative salt-induced outer membrane protein YdiY